MQSGTRPRNLFARLLVIAIAGSWCGGCGNSESEPAATARRSESQSAPTKLDDVRVESSDRLEPSPAETPTDRTAEPHVEKPLDSSEETPEGESEMQSAETLPATATNASDSATSGIPAAPGDRSSLPVPTSMPTVVMTEAHAATCLVKVGEVFPEVTLNDSFGEPTTLASLRGEKLTVVLFWNARTPYGIAQLHDLETYVQSRFNSQGVSIVGINVGDTTETVRDITSDKGIAYPQLLDSDGSLYRQVATQCIPRVYLLDTQRTILWLDLEYSVGTMRHLLQAIRFQIES